MYGKGVALSDTLAIKSDDLLNNHLATIILVTPSRINGTVSNDSTPTTAAGTSIIFDVSRTLHHGSKVYHFTSIWHSLNCLNKF
jgi:hypothetical protein